MSKRFWNWLVDLVEAAWTRGTLKSLPYRERVELAHQFIISHLELMDASMKEGKVRFIQNLDAISKSVEGLPQEEELRDKRAEVVENTICKVEEIVDRAFDNVLRLISKELGADAVAEARERVRKERS